MTSKHRPSVAIVGGGTMGLAAAWALARRGVEVRLFERFDHVHERGSHGGYTRAIRHAYHEGSDYVELVERADREWTALGERLGQTLLVRCGLLEFGSPDDPEFEAALASLREHDIDHELLDVEEVEARFPVRLPEDWLGCLSPRAGYLRVQACLDALRREAEDSGAELHHGARVRELALGGDRPRLLLDDGAVVAADRIIVAAGAWASELLPGLFDPPLKILRRVLAWTTPAAGSEVGGQPGLGALPVWAGFVPEGFFYGFPDHGEGLPGFKLACHEARAGAAPSMDQPCDPEQVERQVTEAELDFLRTFLERYIPGLAGEFTASKTCLYTRTQSGDFWIDRHPEHASVLIAAGFSGHGFKFAPVVGLALADLVLDGRSGLALERFARRAHGG